MPVAELESALVVNSQRLLNEYLGGYMEVIGQRKAKGSGTTVGAPDALLYRRKQIYVVEFKRPGGGRLSRGQELAIYCREQEGVPTYVVTSEQDFADMIAGKLAPMSVGLS